MQARRRLYPQGVKLRRLRILFRDFRETGDNTTAITKNTDGTALPVTLAGLVGMLELTQQIFHHAGPGFVLVVCQTFEPLYKARPWTALQCIQQRGVVCFFRHDGSDKSA